jgi:hypothetical protein
MRTPLLAVAVAVAAALSIGACLAPPKEPTQAVTPTVVGSASAEAAVAPAAPMPEDDAPVNPVAWKAGLSPDFADHAKSCDRGEISWCTVVATSYESEGEMQDVPRAVAVYKKMCDLGNAPACEKAGTMVLAGKSGSPDAAQGLDLLGKACDAGSAGACLTVAVHYEKGDGVKKDPKKAKAAYGKACDAGTESACKKGGKSKK